MASNTIRVLHAEVDMALRAGDDILVLQHYAKLLALVLAHPGCETGLGIRRRKLLGGWDLYYKHNGVERRIAGARSALVLCLATHMKLAGWRFGWLRACLLSFLSRPRLAQMVTELFDFYVPKVQGKLEGFDLEIRKGEVPPPV